ncbi:ABC transporter ATP-binding protein [Bacillus subtilis]|nr:ABC transporter ATP-binding protein [Bacillus subtilis]
MNTLLAVDQAHITYGKGRRSFTAVQNVSFDVIEGRCLGLVGESGSGKSSLARAIVGMVPLTAGRITLRGAPVQREPGPGGVQMIFQDPTASLNPRRTLLDIVSEPLRIAGTPKATARSVAEAALHDVGLEATTYGRRRPAEISGGQAQRVAIARAVTASPALIVADEPVSGLDVSVQAGIINLLHNLSTRHGTSLLFISHDLSVIRTLCDDAVVLHQGTVKEEGPVESVLTHPADPYTRELIAAVPEPGKLLTPPTAGRTETNVAHSLF